MAEVRKILFVENLAGEKRRERLHIGEFRGTQKLVIPWARVGSGLYSLFFVLSEGGDVFQMQMGIS
jgi:hypothetical protein